MPPSRPGRYTAAPGPGTRSLNLPPYTFAEAVGFPSCPFIYIKPLHAKSDKQFASDRANKLRVFCRHGIAGCREVLRESSWKMQAGNPYRSHNVCVLTETLGPLTPCL